MNINGEFSFNLTEKTDSTGRKYLFAGLNFLNAVLFIRRDPADPSRWRAVLKPYRPKSPSDTDEHGSVWSDDDIQPQAEDKSKGSKR